MLLYIGVPGDIPEVMPVGIPEGIDVPQLPEAHPCPMVIWLPSADMPPEQPPSPQH
ncbi:MAG TPA: hypothetical protein VGM05_21925 [Planctomycetaceae bacterium]|jgi:hypothetical protein